jgi:hypothetical protein
MNHQGNPMSPSLPGVPPAPPIPTWGSSSGSDADSVALSEETKLELRKIGAEYTIKDGLNRSVEDIIKLLIKEHWESSSK